MSRDSDVVESELFALASEWKERALAAEQRAEAAETERDRMRPVVEAALMWSKWNPKHGLLAAIDAYRAGQPATSEAERIAAWLDRSAPSIAARFRTGEWRKVRP